MLLYGRHQLETAERVLEVSFVEGFTVWKLTTSAEIPFSLAVSRLDDLRKHISGRQQAYILASDTGVLLPI